MPVTIKIIVTASNEARFYSFVLNKAFNANLKEDVAGIIDNENRTITLRLPRGMDVTSLAPNIDYGAGTGATVPDEFTSGNKHDFTNPVQYVLTAPDRVTQVIYTVSVVFYDESQGGVTPTPTATPTGTPVPTAVPTNTPVPTSTPIPTVAPTNTPVPPVAPTSGYKVGTTVKHSATNGYYKVTGTNTVEYIKPVKKKVSTVTIPDSVNLKGTNYK